MLSMLFGLATACCWGMGDFIGGSNSRRVGAYGMTLGTIGCGLLLLLLVSLGFDGNHLPLSGWLFCLLAGAFDAVGILLLYLSLTQGRMSLAAPVSALTAAALPVFFSILTLGLPEVTVMIGLLLGLAAIWMISREQENAPEKPLRFNDLYLPLLSGSCLGIFLILMHAGSHHALLWPMIAVRTGGVTALLLILLTRLKHQMLPTASLPWKIIVVNALLDVGGNGFYILASQAGRLDVAAVLSALYPAVTVFMAWLLLKEKVSRLQFTGILSALGAIALLAL